jgi:hypothetical protein
MFLIYLSHILGLRKGQKIITLEIFAYRPDPNPVASPVVPASTPILKPPPLPRRGKKRTIEAVLKEAEETTSLQRSFDQTIRRVNISLAEVSFIGIFANLFTTTPCFCTTLYTNFLGA